MNFNLNFKSLSALLLLVFSINIYAQEYNVAWSKLKGVTSDSSNTLTKTDVNGWNNTSALSDNKLKKNEDGYVKYIIEDVSNNRIIGLTSRNNSTNYQEIDYAVAILGSRAFIIESGRVKGYLGRVGVSDEIKIAREGSRIVYYKNSSISRRTNTDPEFKLFVDISLFNQNATLTGVVASFAIQIKIDLVVTDADCDGSGLGSIDATITGGIPPYTFAWDNGTTSEDLTDVAPGQYKLTVTDAVGYQNSKKEGIYANVVWDTLNGITNNSGNLTKSISGNQWNTSAMTSNLLSSNSDGRIEYIIDNKNTQRAFGFSASQEGLGYTNIDYCVVLSNNKKMYVVENGSVKSITKYKIDDVVSIFRVGNKIKYKLNNDLVYKSTVDPTEDLYLLGSIRTPNASINGLKVNFCPPRQDFVLEVTKISDLTNGINGLLPELAKLGEGVIGAGDVNEDGFDDLLVSYSRPNEVNGLALLFLDGDLEPINIVEIGNDPLLASKILLDERFATSLSMFPDLNRDGKNEFYASAILKEGVKFDESGNPRNVKHQGKGYIFQLTKEGRLEWVKQCSNFIVNEILTESEPIVSEKRKALIVDPSAPKLIEEENNPSPYDTIYIDSVRTRVREGVCFGFSAESIGDIDGNGYDDLAIGSVLESSLGTETNEGAVNILFLGEDFNVIKSAEISRYSGGLTNNLDDQNMFGYSITKLDDMDGDGIHEIAVSGKNVSKTDEIFGKVWVISLNVDGTVKSDYTIESTLFGANDPEFFGSQLATIDDMDGDNFRELIITSKDANYDGKDNSGAIRFVSLQNNTPTVLQEVYSNYNGMTNLDTDDNYGKGLSYLGNLNDNGFAYIASGAVGDDDGGTDKGSVYLSKLDIGLDFRLKFETTVSNSIEDLFQVDIVPFGGSGVYYYNFNDNLILNNNQFNHRKTLLNLSQLENSEFMDVNLSGFISLPYNSYLSYFQNSSIQNLNAGVHKLFLLDSKGRSLQKEVFVGDDLIVKSTNNASLLGDIITSTGNSESWNNYVELDQVIATNEDIIIQSKLSDLSTEFVVGAKIEESDITEGLSEFYVGYGLIDGKAIAFINGQQEIIEYSDFKINDEIRLTYSSVEKLFYLTKNGFVFFKKNVELDFEVLNQLTKVKGAGSVKGLKIPWVANLRRRDSWKVEDANCGGLGSIVFKPSKPVLLGSVQWYDSDNNAVPGATSFNFQNVSPGMYYVTYTSISGAVSSVSIEVAYKVSWSNLNNTNVSIFPNENTLNIIPGPSLVWNYGDAKSYNELSPTISGWMDFVNGKSNGVNNFLRHYGFSNSAGFTGYFVLGGGNTALGFEVVEGAYSSFIPSIAPNYRLKLDYNSSGTVSFNLTKNSNIIIPGGTYPSIVTDQIKVHGGMLNLGGNSSILDAKTSFCPIAPSYIPLTKELGNTFYRPYNDLLYIKWDEKYISNNLVFEIKDLNNNIVHTGNIGLNLGTNYTTVDLLSSSHTFVSQEFYVLTIYSNKNRIGSLKFKYIN
jgi:hypothetical protein